MAKLLISCDNSLYKYKGNYFFKNEEWYQFYLRYLRVFDEIKIANRIKTDDEAIPSRVMVNDDRIEVVDMPSFSGPYDYAKKLFKIRSCIKDVTTGCDAAIIRLPSTIGQKVCNKVQKAGLPYAVEVVFDAYDAWHANVSFTEKLLWKKIDSDMKTSCNKAEGVSYVTERYLQKHYPIHKGAFTSHYSSLSLDRSFYASGKKLKTAGPYIIGHVANQVMYNGRKGYNQLIDAVKLIAQRGFDVKVKFGGPSYNNGIELLKEYAENLGIGDRVEFEGYLNRKQLNEFLESSDLFVLPTTAEGLPRVIIEAMAQGLPCITTDVSGNSELVENDFLFDYGETERIAELVIKLITNKDLYERVSNQNYRKSLEFEATVLQERRDSFYTELKSKIAKR